MALLFSPFHFFPHDHSWFSPSRRRPCRRFSLLPSICHHERKKAPLLPPLFFTKLPTFSFCRKKKERMVPPFFPLSPLRESCFFFFFFFPRKEEDLPFSSSPPLFAPFSFSSKGKRRESAFPLLVPPLAELSVKNDEALLHPFLFFSPTRHPYFPPFRRRRGDDGVEETLFFPLLPPPPPFDRVSTFFFFFFLTQAWRKREERIDRSRSIFPFLPPFPLAKYWRRFPFFFFFFSFSSFSRITAQERKEGKRPLPSSFPPSFLSSFPLLRSGRPFLPLFSFFSATHE